MLKEIRFKIFLVLQKKKQKIHCIVELKDLNLNCTNDILS